MSVVEMLNTLGMPVTYMTYQKQTRPPFIAYHGDGQQKFIADDIPYLTQNEYTVEYYFTDKSSAREADIEAAFTACGYAYDKSEDVYISDEKLNVIYYTIWRVNYGRSE